MNTTREAALEAALKLARNRMQACAIDHPTGSREMYERSEWANEATAALSTPATEPQGYVEITEEMIVAGRKAADDQYYKWRGFGPREEGQGLDGMHFIVREALKAALAARPAPQPASEHEYPDPLIAEDRYEDDQPAADTRVVKPLVWKPEDAPCTRFKAEALGGHMMIVELDPETHPGTYSVGIDLGGLCFKFILAEYDDFLPKYTAPAKFEGIEAAKAAAQADYETRILSAIIGTATPVQPDKNAEAAIDRCMQEIEDIICEADVSYPAGRDAGTSIDFDRDAVLAALRALAGKGE